jgi:hypothetical protein
MTDQELRAHKQSHTKQNSWWLNDAKGIPLSRVCDECEQAVIDSYPPEVTGRSGRYEDVVEEAIEPDDY